MLSIIIPSYKDPLLHCTIDSLLSGAFGEIEIVVVIDGYKLKKPLRNDKRIVKVELSKNVGMRNAINIGVMASSGTHIMRTDEHCMFPFKYDAVLTREIDEDWIVTPMRYKLDPEKWEVCSNPSIAYERLVILKDRKKFASKPWRERDKERSYKLIDEDMAMQGSCWVMTRSWWDRTIGKLQTFGYGTHYQDSVEMVMKTWKSGGKLMLNKMTWYAHKHRKFNRTHNFSKKLADESFRYSLNTWGEYYKKTVLPKWGLA